MAQYRSQAEKKQGEEAPTDTPGGKPTDTGVPGILYETGVGKGEFEGWSLPSNWKHLNGMLVSNGTGPGSNNNFIPVQAQYVPTTANYAVEAEIQTIENTVYGNYGLAVRATNDNKEGYVGLVGRWGNWTASNICYLNSFYGSSDCKAPGQVYSADANWHTYRVEAKGNTINLLVDNSLITTLPDDRYLNADRVGIFTADAEQIQVRNFKVLKLQ